MAASDTAFVECFIEQTRAIAQLLEQGHWDEALEKVEARNQLLLANPYESMQFSAEDRQRMAAIEGLNQQLVVQLEAHYADLRHNAASVRNQIRLNRYYAP